MVWEYSAGQMALNILAHGRMDNSLALGQRSILMEEKEEENGKMANGKDGFDCRTDFILYTIPQCLSVFL